MPVQVEVEQQRRVGQVDLVDIVVDRLAAAAGKVRDGEPVAGEAGPPAAPVEAGDIVHQVDLVDPAGVAHLLDRPDEDPLGTILAFLGTEKDPHRRLGRGLGSGTDP